MKSIQTYPTVAEPQPEGMHRDDMAPEAALFESFDLWAAGCWPDDNATDNLAEVMHHIARLLDIPGQSIASLTPHSTDG